MSGNVNQRAKARRAGAPAWMVGSDIVGVGNPGIPMFNYMRRRTPHYQGTNRDYNPCTNQLSGTGRHRSQFSVTADGINKDSPVANCNKDEIKGV